MKMRLFFFALLLFIPQIAAAKTFSRNLSVGITGADVVALQNFLIQRRFLVMPAGVSKGKYGAQTQAAVRAYQKSVGLQQIGVFGPATRAKVEAILADAGAPRAETVAGPYVYVMQAGAAVKNSGGDVQWPLASITKLMTTLVLQDLQINWDTPVRMIKKDEVGGARLRVKVGGTYSRIDLLHAALMGSANNATNALARTSGLTGAQFVARMNAKAKALGMLQTHFTDPTGIETSNVSTAHDIALLINAAAKDTLILAIEQKESYTMQSLDAVPVVHTIKSTDSLLHSGVDVQVAKTGYLIESKYNFAVRATDVNGNRCTVVVLGAPSMASSIQLASKFGNLQ